MEVEAEVEATMSFMKAASSASYSWTLEWLQGGSNRFIPRRRPGQEIRFRNGLWQEIMFWNVLRQVIRF